MLVHWGGYPNDLDKIKEIQNRCNELYGFKPAVIEDCTAHSFGSRV
jgi:dTDP-4-amino-4,6-dideoxygalactose transaminase